MLKKIEFWCVLGCVQCVDEFTCLLLYDIVIVFVWGCILSYAGYNVVFLLEKDVLVGF